MVFVIIPMVRLLSTLEKIYKIHKVLNLFIDHHQVKCIDSKHKLKDFDLMIWFFGHLLEKLFLNRKKSLSIVNNISL